MTAESPFRQTIFTDNDRSWLLYLETHEPNQREAALNRRAVYLHIAQFLNRLSGLFARSLSDSSGDSFAATYQPPDLHGFQSVDAVRLISSLRLKCLSSNLSGYLPNVRQAYDEHAIFRS